MKKFKKLSIMTLLTVFLLSLGGSSVFAKYGWGDTINDPIILYNSYTNISEVSLPIDSTSDYDFYLIDNRNGSSYLGHSVSLKSPAGLNYDMQYITVDSSGNILSVDNGYDTGAGGTDARGASVAPGHALYVKVFSHGAYDYDSNQNYLLRFSTF